MTGRSDTPPWVDPEWLATIEERKRRSAERWHLAIAGRLGRGNTSRVFACVDRDGRRLVLKLAPPEMRPDVEAAALAAWSGRGAARLVAFEASDGALLLDEVVPGTPLPAGGDDAAVSHAASALVALHSVPLPAVHPFPTQLERLDTWLGWIARSGEPGTAGMDRLADAERAARRLCVDTSRVVLLHGDFIDKNLLLSGDRYVAVDPLPHVGDPCSDAGFFSAYHPPATNIPVRARALAKRCGLEPDRAARWAAVWAVGEATETWRADSAELQAWVRSDEAARLLARASAP